MADAQGAPPAWDLLGDGSLSIRFPPAFTDAVGQWVWPVDELAVASRSCAAAVELEHCSVPPNSRPAVEPTLDARFVAFWRNAGLLLDPGGVLEGRVDLGSQHARIRIRSEGPLEHPSERHAVYAALRVAAGVLLGAQGRVLFHAAAVVDRDGRAWLFPGDTHSGKTTTMVTMVTAGFDYVSDDEVVLVRCPVTDTLRIVGWPRRLTLDEGYASGASQGKRSPVDARRFGPGRRRPGAPVAGVVFPRVDAANPTRIALVTRPDALSRFVRNSPWLLAHPPAAASLLRLLERLASLPAFDLRLGGDSFGNFGTLRHHLPAPLGRA